MILSDLLRLHGRYRPAKPALVEGETTITFAALDRIVDHVCHRLAGFGVSKGDLVGVALPDAAQHLIVLLALARLGAVILPLDCRWSREEKSGVAARFEADWVIVPAEDRFWLDAQLVLDASWFAEGAEPYQDESVTADTPLLLSLSSGTTGMPKGPRLSQGQFVARFMIYWIDLGLNSHHRFLAATPLYFGGGRGFPLAILYAGGTVIMFPPPYDSDALVAEAARHRATSTFLVPTLLRRLLERPRRGLAFPSISVLIASGSTLFAAEQREIRARLTPNLYQYYASTEGGGVSLLRPDAFERHPDSVGQPCFGVRVEVVDQNHEPVPAGEVGLLRYRSPASPLAYYKGDSASAFRDGWFYPGDLASFDADGFLTLRGRAKDMIIRGGVNIYPADVEQVLAGIDGVSEAAVVGVPSPEFGEEIVAFVVLSAPLDPAALIAVCRQRLARYKVPGRVIVLDSLLKNAGGKVLKPILVRLAAEQM